LTLNVPLAYVKVEVSSEKGGELKRGETIWRTGWAEITGVVRGTLATCFDCIARAVAFWANAPAATARRASNNLLCPWDNIRSAMTRDENTPAESGVGWRDKTNSYW